MNELILVTLYTMLIWGATYYYSRGYTNTKKEFLVANREIGTFSGALSVAATWIWAPALFVSATKAYTSGIPGLFGLLFPMFFVYVYLDILQIGYENLYQMDLH